jgi:hypothetical protein
MGAQRMRTRQGGLTLFEVIAMMTIVAGLSFGAAAAWGEGGWAMVWGALRGAFFGFAGYFVVMMALMTLLALALRWRPMFPTCRQGRCKDTDYRYLYLDEAAPQAHQQLQDSHGGKLLRCACGTVYLDSLRDRRFYEVAEDGSLRPFRRYRPFGRWQPDTGEAPAPS